LIVKTSRYGWQGRRRVVIASTLFGVVPLIRAFASSEKSSGAIRSQDETSANTGPFPLRVEAGKRYLVDGSGHPFLIHGDTAWSLIAQLSREETELYFDDRRAKRFNAVLVNLIEHEYAADPPKNRYGDGPFLIPGDFGTPNERYFAHADHVIARAASKGILVMLAPAYMGFGGGSEGWYREMQANGVNKLRAYGRYLANRFRNHVNILWVHGGDFNPPEKDLMRALASGIRDVDIRSLHTFHGSRGTSATSYLGIAEPWLQVSNIYTDSTTVVGEALHEYAHSQKPFFLIEAMYEGEGADEVTVRLQAYQTVLSGGCGHVMGNLPIWKFADGWQRALSSEGASALSYLRDLLEARAWSRLIPDHTNTFLVDGIKTGKYRAAAAVADDRSFGLVYIPSLRQVTVNLASLAGPKVRMQWYDPSTARFLAAGGSPLPASGLHVIPPAASKVPVQKDWVLVLESIS
jgi:hypothetical protein